MGGPSPRCAAAAPRWVLADVVIARALPEVVSALVVVGQRLSGDVRQFFRCQLHTPSSHSAAPSTFGHERTVVGPRNDRPKRSYFAAIDSAVSHEIRGPIGVTLDNLGLLIDLHITGERQGPGDVAETRRAIELSGLNKRQGLKIADVGCGTGASTLVLAADLDAQIIAVDALPEFLEVLRLRAARAGLAERVTAVNASMDSLPFDAESLDAIWSEGAIYNMGFERVLRRFMLNGTATGLGRLPQAFLAGLTSAKSIAAQLHPRRSQLQLISLSWLHSPQRRSRKPIARMSRSRKAKSSWRRSAGVYG